MAYPIWEATLDLSSLSFWQPPQHCDNDTRRKRMKLAALKDTPLARGEEETHDSGVSLAGEQRAESSMQRLSNSWQAPSSQAQRC